jgi:6-pyruvoyl-tetrahydropterin synthase
MLIAVKHNIEVAHRLYLTQGKCEKIHGHSMKVTLNLEAVYDPKNGIAKVDMQPLEFGAVKKAFRGFLDSEFDHRLLLNSDDPFAQPLWVNQSQAAARGELHKQPSTYLPGLQPFDGDPTTENIARIIAQWAANEFTTSCVVEVWETDVNNATFGWDYEGDSELFSRYYPPGD